MSDKSNDIDTMRLYIKVLSGLLVRTYQFAYTMYNRVPLANKTVEEVQQMTDLFNDAHELGIEIDL